MSRNPKRRVIPIPKKDPSRKGRWCNPKHPEDGVCGVDYCYMVVDRETDLPVACLDTFGECCEWVNVAPSTMWRMMAHIRNPKNPLRSSPDNKYYIEKIFLTKGDESDIIDDEANHTKC